jgi:hypothetical protein
MRLEIVQVPDCPNVALLERRLDEALAVSSAPVERAHRIVEDLETAAAVGMTGSPTLLVDGVDPFAGPGVAPSVSCRLYPGEDGRVHGAPSVAALRRALGLSRALGLAEAGQAASGGAADCCVAVANSSAATVLRDWRAWTTPTDPAERAMHQVILRAFAATGSPPDSDELDQTAAEFGMLASDVLSRLHTTDVVRLGPDGGIRVAYPFSAAPTRHLVRLAAEVEVFAMCAIDALGIPAMLGTDAVITTSDPGNGAPITMTAIAGRFEWNPPTAGGVRRRPPRRPFFGRDLLRVPQRVHRPAPGRPLDPGTSPRPR